MPDTTSIRKASAGEAEQVGGTLASAFFNDPVFTWVCPADERRRILLPAFFTLFAESMMPLDETYVAGENAGAALWAPPGQEAVPEENADEFGRRMEEMAGVDGERMFEVSELIGSHHPSGSFWFLQFVGVDSAHQGRGIGTALLRPILERCDREGARAYLDATSPDNKRLYERHGFRATEEYAPEGGPPLWSMWREPRAG
jgi:GNAT superfamily N-acetyltransferase